MAELEPRDKDEIPLKLRYELGHLAFELIDTISPGLTSYLDLYSRAEEEVRQEKPHLFIEYRQPREARERVKMRRKATKIASRAKKRRNAIQAKLQELGSPDLRETVTEGLTEVQIKHGMASPEEEAEYLESMWER